MMDRVVNKRGGGGDASLLLLVASCLLLLLLPDASVVMAGVTIAPRHCQGHVKHLHLAVGPDPARSMTVSFASTWAFPGRPMFLAGVKYGTSPDQLDQFALEWEEPLTYVQDALHSKKEGELYYAPYQHHITIEDLQPDTTYYYLAVLGDREEGPEALEAKALRDHPSQHTMEVESVEAIEIVANEEDRETGRKDGSELRHLRASMGQEQMDPTTPYNHEEAIVRDFMWDEHGRRLAPPPYDPTGTECIEAYKVRSFRTAPDVDETANGEDEFNGMAELYPMNFGIIGDLGQFEHSKETLTHMRDNLQNIRAVMLVGDIAYPEMDQRRWDLFFDFLDDYSVFDVIPLQIAAGNHDIDKQPARKEIFMAYEHRFRMPRVHPPELGVYEGDQVDEKGHLNMDAPPYPLPYEWGNAYYAFTYGPAKHIVVCAYSDMSPGSTQYEWLEQEFESIDRKRTPWVFVTIHVPLYNTFALHHHDPQIFAAREHLEPLLIKYHVNMVLNGHIHAYQRTTTVAGNVTTPTGPVHVTIGAGGRKADAPFQNEEPESWIVQRDAAMYGYGRIKIFNATHAEWKWVPLSPADEHDWNLVQGEEDIHLPALDHDKLILENQWHVSRRLQKEKQEQ